VEVLGIIPSDNIITLDAHSGLSLARDTLLFLWRARHRRIDTVINMEAFVRYSSMLSYLSGACRRVGFHRFNQEGLYAGDLLTHNVLHNAHIRAAHTFLDLVHALDTPGDQVPRVKRPTSESISGPSQARRADVRAESLQNSQCECAIATLN
jgi:ADP-heptose:LPS heptosyltransferase